MFAPRYRSALMRRRATVIPILAVPVSIVGTFAVMAAFGFSLTARAEVVTSTPLHKVAPLLVTMAAFTFAIRALPDATVRARSAILRPRVIIAARALYPNPSPSAQPTPMATTFLSAPASSTPTTSSVVYARK